MQRATYALILLLCYARTSYAQLFYTPGYVVTLQRDTIRGEIKEKDNLTVLFRKRTGGGERPYTPQEISTYSTENQLVKSANWPENDLTRYAFLKEISTGNVGLFELVKPEARLTHLIQLPDQSFIPLRASTALLLLNQHLTECKDPAVKRLLTIQQFYFSRSYFERVVNTYNRCVSPQKVVVAKKKPLHFETGLLAGGAINSWSYGAIQERFAPAWNQNGVYSSTYTGLIGGYFTIVPRKRLSLTVEGFYTTYKGDKTVYINNPLDLTDKRNRLYSFHEQYLTFPITARYIVGETPLRWYLKAGPSLVYKFDAGGQYTGDNIGTVPIAIKSGVGIGYLVGIGAELPITKKSHLLIELRTAPHIVMDGVTRLANSRSYQLSVALPLIER